MSSPREDTRFVALDGVRGVAALCVAIFHVAFAHGDWLPGAYVAVDIFLCLSGFVLAGAYREQLDAGLGGVDFLKLRIARLYPMYALGLILGLLAHGITLALGAPVTGGRAALLMAVNGALFLPSTMPNQMGCGTYYSLNSPFPYNTVSWSLFFELLANVAFGFFRPRGWRLALVVAALGGALVCSVIKLGYPGGWGLGGFWGGAPRALFEFYLGYGVRQLADAGALPRSRLPLLGPAAILALAWAPFGSGNLMYFTAALVVAPAILVVSLSGPRSPALASLYSELGRLSYPLYALHAPAFKLFIIAAIAITGREDYSPGLAAGLGFVAVLALAAWLLAVYVEPRLRRALSRRSARGGKAAAGAPSPA